MSRRMHGRPTLAHLVMRLRSQARTELADICLAALREFGPLTASDIAEPLGYASPNSIAVALANLTEEGVLTRHRATREPGQRGPAPWVYTLGDCPRGRDRTTW